MTASHQRFSHPFRVRWAEVDMQEIVFNGHYLNYFDIGLYEFFRHIFDNDTTTLNEFNAHLHVVKSTLDYHAPARFDQMLDIQVHSSRVGRSSFTVDFLLSFEGHQLVSGQNIYVYAPGGKPTPISDNNRSILLQSDTKQSP